MKNFRDIACLNVKKGMLYRGEALNHFSSKDKKLLFNECNIKVVVDLRSIQEYRKDKDKIIPGVRYYHLPLIDMREMGASSEKEGKETASREQKLPSMFDYYRLMVKREKKESWSKIFELLLEDNDESIYFHCTAGKDRTGTVSAIILTLLGIDKENIYHDYLLTNEHPVIPFIYKLYSLKLKKEVRKQFKELFYVKVDYLDAMFDEINKVYGSIDNFYRECCSLNEEKIEKLKKKYLLIN